MSQFVQVGLVSFVDLLNVPALRGTLPSPLVIDQDARNALRPETAGERDGVKDAGARVLQGLVPGRIFASFLRAYVAQEVIGRRVLVIRKDGKQNDKTELRVIESPSHDEIDPKGLMDVGAFVASLCDAAPEPLVGVMIWLNQTSNGPRLNIVVKVVSSRDYTYDQRIRLDWRTEDDRIAVNVLPEPYESPRRDRTAGKPQGRGGKIPARNSR